MAPKNHSFSQKKAFLFCLAAAKSIVLWWSINAIAKEKTKRRNLFDARLGSDLSLLLFITNFPVLD